MKYHALFAATLLVLAGSAQAADSLCQQKASEIEHEIALAKKHDNQRRVNGLERALTEAKSGCTDEKLRSAHQERIAADRQKVKEREHELAEERDKGSDHEKIEKREHKLAEAREQLKKQEAARW